MKYLHFISRLSALLLLIIISNIAAAQSIPNQVTSMYGNYSYNSVQVPDNLVSDGANPAGYALQWEESLTPADGFVAMSGATLATFTFSGPLFQTSYYRRKATLGGNIVYSNVLKIELVSANWENINYIREHDILTGQYTTDWKVIDQLPSNEKRVTTSYLDGLGRPVQKVYKEIATPAEGSPPNVSWGDLVEFSEYDSYGRKVKHYLPYSSALQPGKYKTTNITSQAQYFTTKLGETNPFTALQYDNSPLDRVMNIRDPGTSWSAGSGRTVYEAYNEPDENVRKFKVGDNTGDAPTSPGTYDTKTLYKVKKTDENGNQVIEYITTEGKLILKKVQIDQTPGTQHAGWICTYNVYDHFGQLRFTIEPEAVKWLDNNGWSFANTGGTQVFTDLCFRYEYDESGRMIIKKSPGAKELYMVYDDRDRLVFSQDGNQRLLSPPQWLGYIYDGLDRVVLTTLYNTTKTRANLEADIAAAAASSSVTISSLSATVATCKNPISSADLNNSSINSILKVNFYDNYNYAAVKAYDPSSDNTQAYPNTGFPNANHMIKTERTVNLSTGSITRVLGTGTFMQSTTYYTEQGNIFQHLEDNIKSGTDVTTFQYRWDNVVLSVNTKHTAAGTAYSNYSVITKYLHDKLGRVAGIEKKIGSNAFKAVAAYTYDDMGKLLKTRLAPGYTGTGLTEIETLNYSYNILNELTGINKDYALKTGSYNKWNNFFGLYLGYNNADGVFANARLDGYATGHLWNTQGDDAQRKYDFSYDRAGRLSKALFNEKQKTTDAWSNAKMDFSVSGSSGTITYDLNGNLLNMLQKGVVPGGSAPVEIDNLSYTYASNSNKLIKVTDNGTAANNNGKFGDFKPGTPGSPEDYIYDDNGNLVIDLNKTIKDLPGLSANKGVKYNFLDRPEEVRIIGKGTLKIVYDADGRKLQKIFTPEGGGAAVTTSYIDEFIYRDNDLQFIEFEEGRLRVVNAFSANNGYDAQMIVASQAMLGGKRAAFDYFIKDHQGNVRLTLTEQVHTGSNQCTMETAREPNEEPVFGQTGASNEVEVSRFNTPPGWSQNSSAKVSRLGNLAAAKLGPNALMKVMAGDRMSGSAYYYYANPVTNSSGPNNIISSLISSLTQAISGSGATSGIVKDGAVNITGSLNTSVPFSTVTSPHAGDPTGTNPKAYLTILFFDERFNFVEEGSIAVRVETAGDGWNAIAANNIKAPKNGYAYVYLSNESNEHVYFDNFYVTHNRGRIVQEDHYYSYGLKISGISSKRLGDVNEGMLTNRNQFQGEYSEFDEETGWNEFELRDYDPQIGRFIQIDPYDQFSSGYVGFANNPPNNIDIDGGVAVPTDPIKTLTTVVVYSKKASGFSRFLKGAGKFVKGFANGGVTAVVETVKGVVAVVKDPIGTAKALVQTVVHVVKNPREALNGIKESAIDVLNTIKSGDPEAIGNLIGKAAVNLIPGGTIAKGIGGVGKIGSGLKVIRKIVKKLPCGCFIAGTLIFTEAGAKPIEKIAVGDKVWAFNDTTGQYGLKKVVALFRYERDTVFHIQVGKDTIKATADHPFYIAGKWVSVAELKVGDSVKTYDGSNLVIERITLVPGRTTVYNFEVADYHTYYVADAKVLVHNINCPHGITRMKRGSMSVFKGKRGVYEHYYQKKGTGEIVSDVQSYTGKTEDLGGSRAGKSRRQRGRQAGDDYEYMGSRFTEYNGTDAKGLAELEKAKLDANFKDGYKVLNKQGVNPSSFE
ncbi:MAG: hypothetical protein H7Y86_02520 [Rhizobacter sp.]|nr:hypothetical protein [Ferruginibacter sp.]